MGARRIATLLLAATLATGLAACGDDEEEGGGDVVLEDAEAGASSSASGTEEDASATADDAEVAGDLFGEDCGEFVQVFSALGAAVGGSFDAEAAEEFERFVDEAPEEIQDDLETVAGAYQDYADALEDAGFDPEDPSSFDPSDSEAIEAFTEAAESISTEEFAEASAAISEFIEGECEG